MDRIEKEVGLVQPASLLVLVLMVVVVVVVVVVVEVLVVVDNRELEKGLGWPVLGVVRKTDVRRCQGESRQQPRKKQKKRRRRKEKTEARKMRKIKRTHRESGVCRKEEKEALFDVTTDGDSHSRVLQCEVRWLYNTAGFAAVASGQLATYIYMSAIP